MFIIQRETMHFFELLPIPEQQAINDQKHQQHADPYHPQQHASSESTHVQEHITSNHSSSPKGKRFDFLQEVSLLDLDILEICSATEVEEKLDVNQGFIVGIVDQNKMDLKLELDQCFKVKIGPLEQITSITAIRENSLDSLIVFINKGHNSFSLHDILRSKQKLVLVMQEWQEVQTCIQDIEQVLLQVCTERPISQYSNRILLTFSYHKNQFFLSFSEHKQFTEHLSAKLKMRELNFSKNGEEIESLMKMMTIQEYVQFKNNFEVSPFIKRKLALYTKQIEQRMNEKKKKEQIKKFRTLMASEEEKSLSIMSEPQQLPRANQEIIEAQYFSKLNSQVETMDSSYSHRLENEDLYFFIEQHNSESEDQDHNQSAVRHSNAEPQPPKTPNLVRTKSWNSLAQAAEEDLDEEFFTKY